jgi:hypothetical protein
MKGERLINRKIVFRYWFRFCLIVVLIISLPFLLFFKLPIVGVANQLWVEVDDIYNELEDMIEED